MHDEWFTHISCSLCGEWEMFPASMPLCKAQCFTLLNKLENGNGVYQCHCGKVSTSWYAVAFIED